MGWLGILQCDGVVTRGNSLALAHVTLKGITTEKIHVLYMFRGQIGDINVNVNDIKKSLRPESIIKRLERGRHDNMLVELHRFRSLARW
jgi:hypothetical protein